MKNTSSEKYKTKQTRKEEGKTPTLGFNDSAFWVGRMTKQHPHQRWGVLLARWTDLWRWRKGSLSSWRFFWGSLRESPKKSMPGSGNVSHNTGLERQAAQVVLLRGRLCTVWPMEWESKLSVCGAAEHTWTHAHAWETWSNIANCNTYSIPQVTWTRWFIVVTAIGSFYVAPNR